jgi:hypothetical protein
MDLRRGNSRELERLVTVECAEMTLDYFGLAFEAVGLLSSGVRGGPSIDENAIRRDICLDSSSAAGTMEKLRNTHPMAKKQSAKWLPAFVALIRRHGYESPYAFCKATNIHLPLIWAPLTGNRGLNGITVKRVALALKLDPGAVGKELGWDPYAPRGSDLRAA